MSSWAQHGDMINNLYMRRRWKQWWNLFSPFLVRRKPWELRNSHWESLGFILTYFINFYWSCKYNIIVKWNFALRYLLQLINSNIRHDTFRNRATKLCTRNSHAVSNLKSWCICLLYMNLSFRQECRSYSKLDQSILGNGISEPIFLFFTM